MSTWQWPPWCFQQKGFINTQWNRNLCLVISKRRLVQIHFKLFTAHYDIGTESYRWPMAATVLHIMLPSRCFTQDFWDITPYRLVGTKASKDRNVLIFRVQQYNKRLLRRLDLENETVYQFTRCDISEVLKLQPQLYENLKSLVLSHFHFDYWKLLLADGLMFQQFVFPSASTPLAVE